MKETIRKAKENTYQHMSGKVEARNKSKDPINKDKTMMQSHGDDPKLNELNEWQTL